MYKYKDCAHRQYIISLRKKQPNKKPHEMQNSTKTYTSTGPRRYYLTSSKMHRIIPLATPSLCHLPNIPCQQTPQSKIILFQVCHRYLKHSLQPHHVQAQGTRILKRKTCGTGSPVSLRAVWSMWPQPFFSIIKIYLYASLPNSPKIVY